MKYISLNEIIRIKLYVCLYVFCSCVFLRLGTMTLLRQNWLASGKQLWRHLRKLQRDPMKGSRRSIYSHACSILEIFSLGYRQRAASFPAATHLIKCWKRRHTLFHHRILDCAATLLTQGPLSGSRRPVLSSFPLLSSLTVLPFALRHAEAVKLFFSVRRSGWTKVLCWPACNSNLGLVIHYGCVCFLQKVFVIALHFI